jgi:hypothetical protein
MSVFEWCGKIKHVTFIQTEFEDVMVGTVNKDRSSSEKAKRNAAVQQISVRH